MKKFFASMIAATMAVLTSAVAKAADPTSARLFGPRMARRQGGFVLLSRNYNGYSAGSIVELNASTEAALIASGGAVTSAGPATPGNVTTTELRGCVTFTGGASVVIITNPNITVQSQIWAQIVGGGVDATFTQIARVNPANGQVSIVANAAATGLVSVDWCILNPNGSFSNPQ